jgi:hypothetical protein
LTNGVSTWIVLFKVKNADDCMSLHQLLQSKISVAKAMTANNLTTNESSSSSSTTTTAQANDLDLVH